MRLLITTFTFPPNADGVSEASAVLARGLAERGHEVTVATSRHSQRSASMSDNRLRFQEFDLAGTGGRADSTEARRYQDFLLRFEGDAILFECWDMWNNLLAVPVLGQLKTKKVLVSHGYMANVWIRYPRFPWGLWQWARRLPFLFSTAALMRRYDHLVVLSKETKWNRFFDVWLAKVTRFARSSVIANGARLNEFEGPLPDFRRAYGIKSGPLLLCVANYCERKNQEMALHAFRKARLKDATLVFIGSEFNDYSRNLQVLDEELRQKFPAGEVKLLEKIRRENTCAAYVAADVFVLSAKAETQPIVLLEAIASRTPFISTDTGCVTEIPGGRVVRSELEMTFWMQEMARSAELRESLAEEGWKASREKYNWERAVGEYERLLLNLTGGRRDLK